VVEVVDEDEGVAPPRKRLFWDRPLKEFAQRLPTIAVAVDK
jgi:hypothetical protein